MNTQAGNAADEFMGSGDSLKFDKIGDIHQGKLVRIDSRSDTKPDGSVVKWDDGTPKKVFLWTLQVGTEDDELATLWVRGNLVKVLRAAVADAGAKKGSDLIGATVIVKHHAVGEPKAGMQGAKLYQAKVTLAPPDQRAEPEAFDPFAT